MDAGIDYGKFEGSNRNVETGIHYGVISQHSLGQAIYDIMSEGADYGKPTYPQCGIEAHDTVC